MQRVTIDLSKLHRIVDIGVRRAAVFMGLGINAANDENNKNYELSNITSFRFLPENITDLDINHFKEEFTSWITMNGFRELIETFSIFLDRVFDICQLINQTDKKTQDKFYNKGIEGKTKMLNELFSINTPYTECISSINKARNCFAHRNGVVSEKDCTNGCMVLKWMTIEVYAISKTGTTYILELPIKKEGVKLEEESKICVRLIERRECYNISDSIRISPIRLAEICYFIIILKGEVVKETVKYLKECGVNFID